jgi:hypothetical protein
VQIDVNRSDGNRLGPLLDTSGATTVNLEKLWRISRTVLGSFLVVSGLIMLIIVAGKRGEVGVGVPNRSNTLSHINGHLQWKQVNLLRNARTLFVRGC